MDASISAQNSYPLRVKCILRSKKIIKVALYVRHTTRNDLKIGHYSQKMQQCLELLIRQLQRRVFLQNFCIDFIVYVHIYFRYYENLTPVMVVSDVDMIKQILVKEFTRFNVRKV